MADSLEATRKLIRETGNKLGLDGEILDGLLVTNQEHVFEIELDDGRRFKAYRVQHDNRRGPYKGGIRFHSEVDLDEVRLLATLMSLKTAAVGLPLGGGKGGVSVDPKQLTDTELEEVSRKYVRHLKPHIGPDQDVPAPDVNTDARIIDWMVDEYEQLTGDTSKASFTGKHTSHGGSEGREAATGRGGVIALAELLRHEDLASKQLTVGVQGFGNVGSFFATIGTTEHPSWRLVAASDSGATLNDPAGLDARELADFKRQRGRFKDYEGVKIGAAEDIIGADIDVLVLAALGNSIDESNMKSVRAQYIVELANGPVTSEAHDYLTKQGKTIIPDIIANAGGVIVSYLEWLQNRNDEHWSEDQVNAELKKYLTQAMDELYRTAAEQQVSLKDAAYINALRRLAAIN